MTSLRAIADALDLHRSGNDWRGECPACHYGTPTLIVKERRGRIRFSCVSCGDRNQIAAALEAAGAGDHIDRQADTPAADKAAEGRRRKQERAIRFWTGSGALTGGDPASAYLRNRWVEFAIGNPALRYRPDMPHPSNRKLPALVCCIYGPAGEQLALQRIFIDHNGQKADIDPQKAVMGPLWTGAIRFGTGPAIVVAEGPETALSAGYLLGLPAWSAISAGNLAKGLILPPAVRRVTIAADNDPPGIEAAEAAALRWKAEGRTVRIMVPEKRGEDFNDVLAARAGRAA